MSVTRAMLQVVARKSVAGGSAYPNVQLAPTADQSVGADFTTAPLWSKLDDHDDSAQTDWISIVSDNSVSSAVIQCDASGNTGTVSAVDVICRVGTGTAMDISVSVSDDNSTWETDDTQTWPAASTLMTHSFTGLSWVDPSIIYVRFTHPANSTWTTQYMFSFEVDVNP